MFGLGLWEIATIALVIVLFVKPSELPRAARTVGRVVRRIQSVSAQARAEMRQLGAALERTDLERDAPSPPDDAIHPMQTRPTEEDAGAGDAGAGDAGAGDGYIDHARSERPSSGDAVER